MDMVLAGPCAAALAEMRLPDESRRIAKDDMLIYGLEVAGPGGHRVQFSRSIWGDTRSEESQADAGRLMGLTVVRPRLTV